MKKIDIIMPVYSLFPDKRSQVRVKKALEATGIHSLEDLCKVQEEDFVLVKGIGKKTREAIYAKMKAAELKFGMSDEALRKYEADAICDRIEEEKKCLNVPEEKLEEFRKAIYANAITAMAKAVSRTDESFKALNKPLEEVKFEDVRQVAKDSVDILFDFMKDLLSPDVPDSQILREQYL